MANIWVFAEQTAQGDALEGSLEAIAAARQLGDEVTAVLFAGTEKTETALCQAGADKVLSVQHAGLSPYNVSYFTDALVSLIQERQPDVVLAGSSSIASDFLPRVAARLKTGLILNCLALDDHFIATKAVMGEQQIATETIPETKPKIFTLRAKAYAKPVPDASRTVNVETCTPELSTHPKTRLIEIAQADSNLKKLEDAEVIVSGGRGLKAPENFQMVEELARLLGGSVGATRAVTDAGWRPYSEQIGQTGKTVSPKLYIALGISGQIQHVVGMDSSKLIIAVNKDENAPIFEIADFGMIGDIFQIVPLLIKTLQERS